MKLYHLDRSGHIREGQVVDKIKDVVVQKDFLKKYNDEVYNEFFPDGISSHGKTYFHSGYGHKDFAIDIIYEYERRLNYPEKLSRYEAFFAFDIDGLVEFVTQKELDFEFMKIYEVEVEEYERHNMNLLRGWAHFDTIIAAKYYWEDQEDYRDVEPHYEYLVKLPVTIGKEVDYSDLKAVVDKKKENKAKVLKPENKNK